MGQRCGWVRRRPSLPGAEPSARGMGGKRSGQVPQWVPAFAGTTKVHAACPVVPAKAGTHMDVGGCRRLPGRKRMTGFQRGPKRPRQPRCIQACVPVVQPQRVAVPGGVRPGEPGRGVAGGVGQRCGRLRRRASSPGAGPSAGGKRQGHEGKRLGAWGKRSGASASMGPSFRWDDEGPRRSPRRPSESWDPNGCWRLSSLAWKEANDGISARPEAAAAAAVHPDLRAGVAPVVAFAAAGVR